MLFKILYYLFGHILNQIFNFFVYAACNFFAFTGTPGQRRIGLELCVLKLKKVLMY